MHLAGARAAWVTIITLLLVSVLSAIDILFGQLEGATAGALRTALPCLIFILVAYLLFEAKVVGLLFHLAAGQFQGNWYYAPPPPLSFVGTFSSPGPSVGRGLSSVEATAGGRDAASPARFEPGYTESESDESGYVAEPSPPSFPEGYSRRPPTRTTTARSTLRPLSHTSRSSSPSSGASNLTSDEDVEDDASSTTTPTWGEYQYLLTSLRYAASQDEADDEHRAPGGDIKPHGESKR